MKPVVLETWTESEQGWGTRPDGVTIHLNEDDYKKFVENYWEREKARTGGKTPYEYTRNDQSPRTVFVSDSVYKKLKKKKNNFGLRFWQSEFNQLRNEKQIIFRLNEIKERG